MFERFRNRNRTVDDRGSDAVTAEADHRDRPAREGNGRTRRSTGVATADTMSTVRARQREEFGGIMVAAIASGHVKAVTDGLEALASQVALALESAALTDEVHRRRG